MKTITKFPSSIANISIFGSHVRNDSDELSDLDFLILVRDGTGKTPDAEILTYGQKVFGKPPSLSWYGINKLKTMFNEGHLFAWHLYLESKPIEEFPAVSSLFGRPNNYQSALADIAGLQFLVEGVKTAIYAVPENAAFELGILYVCARNIAMSASWHLLKTPDFTRHSPYKLGRLNCPVEPGTYNQAMRCRMAGQRGLAPPTGVSKKDVLEFRKQLLPWIEELIMEIKNVHKIENE